MLAPRSIARFLYAFLLLAPPAAAAQGSARSQDIGRTTERELNVVLTATGTLIFRKGESEKTFAVIPRNDESAALTAVDYAIRNRVGYADMTLGETPAQGGENEGSFSLESLNHAAWELRFSDAIPISFDVELKVGRGDINLSGLQVKDFRLSAGAGDVTLAFDSPNDVRIDNLTIESGVGKLHGRSLGNAMFKRFDFKGGAGVYTLDFSGSLPAQVDVEIEVGLGVATILIPREVGARVSYERSWVSRIDCDEDFSSSGENQYSSDNYTSASSLMNIRVSAGLGNIRVRRP
jgi:hypothetical protein